VEHRLSNSPARGKRIELIDALRALALAGILQVNIQSFVWGGGDPLGPFPTVPSSADILVHMLVGTFVSTKFISIFAFLFGVGAALQYRSIRASLRATHSGADLNTQAGAVYRRRLWFLLGVGAAHGVLLYFGDILAFYALCGFVLVHYLPRRPAPLVRTTIRWWIAAVVVIFATILFSESVRRRIPVDGDPTLIPAETLHTFTTYTTTGFFEQIATRANDYFGLVVSMLIFSVPQIVALFLLGLLAGKLGWLARPARNARVWQVATWIGLVALPIAAYGEWLNFESVMRQPGDPSSVGYVLQFFGSATACFYVGLLVRLRDRAPVAALIRWVAPVGRMPLTNYLAQSVVMSFLLSGWGLGWGAEFNRAELALLALAIIVVQWPLSRWWIARFGQGPVEALWARVTYRDGPGSNSTFNQTPR